MSSKIKKTKRLHQLYQDWLKIKDIQRDQSIFKQPMAGKWYYTYSNDKGMAVGLAKLQHINFIWRKNGKQWMWETCTANEELELRRFPTQKAAEEAIYKFLS